RIIECSWNSHEDGWIFVQIQTDKSNPDYISFYEEKCLEKAVSDLLRYACSPIYLFFFTIK
ncbi:hypothetical protein HAX54_046196, partial [Datura stramonium]|nr:hypothetical protein [Datura stramonium]